MAYRRTDNVVRRLAARKESIVAAALSIAGEGGMAAIQIAPIAERADIAAGTVYRYFPGKTELLAALIAMASERELAAVRHAADTAPGPLSALAAAIAAFAARALRHRRLAYALIAEPVDPDVDAIRCRFRKSLVDELVARVETAVAGGHLPEQDAALAAPALVGALVESLVGPFAPDLADDVAKARAAVQALTLFSLRALGVLDARARGIVVQTPVPWDDGATEPDLTSSTRRP